jgi:DNA polymerase-4
VEKAIVHLDMDTFFVSCERLANDSLKGIPLIIGGNKGRGVVTCASMEARRFGVRSGMPQFMANKLCPQAKVIRGDYELYAKCSETVTEIIQDNAPLMEKSSIDEFYIDISGMDKYFGCLKWTSELRSKIIHESGLPISFGLSINKTVSKMATNEGKPMGQLMIAENEVKPFMNPLPIIRLPGIGPSTCQTLSRIGIRQIGTLADIPREVMGKLLGKTGLSISQKAKGIDLTPVKPYSKRKSISKERTFQQDTIDKGMLHTILSGMVEDLCFQLRTENWLTSNVSVKIKYTNFDTHTKQVSVGHTACDMTIRKIAYKLLENVYQRRMRIRLIGISFSKLVNGRYQINMFDDTEQKIKLYQAMDGIKNRFNPNVIQWGTGFSNLKTDHQVKIENALAESKVEFKSSAHMYESLGGHNKYNN